MNSKKYLMRDLGIIALSIMLAVLFAKTVAIENLFAATRDFSFITAFLAGMFFISVFTAAPSLVVLVELFRVSPFIEVAFFGALGSMLGDLIIFRFVRDRLAREVGSLLGKSAFWRFLRVSRSSFFRWLMPFLGALIIASPFPDELGLAFMGLSKIRTSLFLILSFALNFSGILVIGLIADGV